MWLRGEGDFEGAHARGHAWIARGKSVPLAHHGWRPDRQRCLGGNESCLQEERFITGGARAQTYNCGLRSGRRSYAEACGGIGRIGRMGPMAQLLRSLRRRGRLRQHASRARYPSQPLDHPASALYEPRTKNQEPRTLPARLLREEQVQDEPQEDACDDACNRGGGLRKAAGVVVRARPFSPAAALRAAGGSGAFGGCCRF